MGNIIANWAQNGIGNWNKMNQEANAPAQQWATESMKNNNVQDLTAPQQPVTPPYNPGVQVVQPQKTVVQQQKPQTQPVLNGNSSTAGMDYLNSLYTSPQEEERLRKASAMNQKILAVGDALRHIGNIANTVNYAPAQQLNNPVAEENARYERGKALRDKANQQYYAYQQAKAAQDAKIRQWEAEQKQKAAQWDATFKFNAAKAAEELEERRRQFDTKQKATDTHNEWLRGETERSHKANEALRRQHNGIAAGSLALRREEFKYKKDNGYYGRGATKTPTGRGNGYTYSTKNGSVTIPADYLSKNKINKRSLLTAMKSAGAIDSKWLDNYDRAIWNEKQQEQMLDDAVSNWLMSDDSAEEYMVKHLKGESSHTDNSKERINGFGGSSSGKERISGFGGY